MDQENKNEKKTNPLLGVFTKLITVFSISIGLMLPNFYDDYKEQQYLKDYLIEDDTTPIVEIKDPSFKKAFLKAGMDLNKDGQFSEYEANIFLEKERYRRNERRKGIGWIVKGTNSLEGFQIFKEMEFISFSGSEIEGLEPLEGLEHLDYISITGANITDVTPLTKMPALKKALLYENKIEDLTPLLEYYDREIDYVLDDNPLGRGNPNTVLLGYIPDLNRNFPVFEPWDNVDKELLKSSEIIDFEPALKSKLLKLGIDIDQDGEISIYEAHRIRGRLNLANYSKDGSDSISDISGIQHFIGIKSLNLEQNEIENIDEVFKLKELRWLNASRNNITSIEGSSSMPNLTKIQLSGNPLLSLEGVSKFIELKEIYAGRCDFTSIDELYELSNLTKVIIDDNSIESLDGIDSLVNLETLQADYCEIKDISVLMGMKKLNNLQVTYNPLYDKNTPNAKLLGELLRYEVYVIE